MPDDDWDSPDDPWDHSLPQTVICPHCEAELDDESLVCPVCDKPLSKRTGPWAHKPLMWQLLMVLLVCGLLSLMLWPFFGWLF